MTETKSLDQALAEAFSKADHLQAPLDQRLKLYLGESRKLLPEMEATYDQLVARIAANIEDSNRIPGVGEVLPDFCMTDSEGKLVELATLLAKGPLVVSFNRGPWCDYCGLELHSSPRLSRHRRRRRRRHLHRAGNREICPRATGGTRRPLPGADRH